MSALWWLITLASLQALVLGAVLGFLAGAGYL